MSEEITEAGAEGTLDEFEKNDDRMQHRQYEGDGDGGLLQRGLHAASTPRLVAGDPSSSDSRKANILRGKHPMTLSQQAADGRPRGNPGDRRQETENG